MGISYIRSFCIVLGSLTTEEFAAGIILVVALIAAFVFSILWNKGILPRTMYVARSSPFLLRILARVE
jgi:ABC-type glucose/galactose transport system permease subunit